MPKALQGFFSPPLSPSSGHAGRPRLRPAQQIRTKQLWASNSAVNDGVVDVTIHHLVGIKSYVSILWTRFWRCVDFPDEGCCIIGRIGVWYPQGRANITDIAFLADRGRHNLSGCPK